MVMVALAVSLVECIFAAGQLVRVDSGGTLLFCFSSVLFLFFIILRATEAACLKSKIIALSIRLGGNRPQVLIFF